VKNHFLILALLLTLGPLAKAQEVIKQASCFNSALKAQSDSIKKEMAAQGFVLVREASMTMESGYEMPVIVPLTEGTWYHFAFIGDISSKLYEVRMYDFNERQVVYQKHYGDGMESNIISFSYIPKFTEYHMIKPVQINKKKKDEVCGYIMMFKKVK
jgi:hypothetical protein